jgi:hypothetical protein
MPSLLISDAEFRLLPTNVQQILMANFLPEAENAGDPTASDEGEEPPDISPAQAKKIILGCGSKTVDVIRQIAQAPVSGFKLTSLEKKADVESGGLRGSWTGLTKVSRRILGDPDATLIWWTELEDGTWHGRVSVMTHNSFRKALDI